MLQMTTFTAWIESRLGEVSTYTGALGAIITTVAAVVFHKEIAASDAATIATMIAGLVSGGLITVTTKNPSALIGTVVADIPTVITVAGDLKAQAHVALAAGEPAKYSVLIDQHNASNTVG
jgi:hypothetical protein